jgi:DNA modification methylase
MTPETFAIGNATLYCGDCREIIDSLTFDACITDPPYGLGKITKKPWEGRSQTKNLHSGGTWATKKIYQNIDWDDEAPCVAFLLAHNVPTMIFGGNYFKELPPSRKWIVWDKGEVFYRRSFAEAELCWCSFDGNIRIFKYIPDANKGFTHNKSKIQKVHPTQKPVKLMEFCISELPKNTESVICDPYMGSGSTGVAAINLGKTFVGIEKSPQYFDIACQRIEKAYKEYQNLLPEIKQVTNQNQLFLLK